MRCFRPSRYSAFTLVELLVVIAIIGILIGLLLPAIQSARESARRAKCQNNLKQLALAVLNFEDANSIFPPCATWVNDDPSNIAHGKDNWVIKILPFMDYNSLYDQFNHQKPISDPSNEQARSQVIPEMLCSSDIYSLKPFNGTKGGGTTAMGDNWARGDYGGNGALGFLDNTGGEDSAGKGMTGWLDPRIRGIMGSDCA